MPVATGPSICPIPKATVSAPIAGAQRPAGRLRRTKTVVEATTAKKAAPKITADRNKALLPPDASGRAAPRAVNPINATKAWPCCNRFKSLAQIQGEAIAAAPIAAQKAA